MLLEKVKKLLEADSKLLDHSHWNDSAKLKDKSYNYAEHYRLLSEAEKEVNKYASKNEF